MDILSVGEKGNLARGSKAPYYRALQEAAKAINSNLTTKEILQLIIKETVKPMSADASCLMVLDTNREHLIPVAAHGLSDWYLRKGFLAAEKSLPETLEGKTATVIDASKDSRIQYPELAAKAGIVSMLSSPLMSRGEVIGAIRIYTHQEHEFSIREKDFVASMADLSAIALEKAELRELLTRKDAIEITPTPPHFPTELAKPKKFAHSSEEEFAKVLDFYKIEWLYEPRSFPLRWEEDRVTEMFTPDFYLPELDLYVELTTLKQSLITEKNRKLRHLRELHPEINIKLLTKKDYHRLLAKYGYGPLGETKVKGIDRILFSQNQVQKRVRELAQQISQDYKDKHPILVGVLKGVVCFMADLMRQVSIPVEVDFLAISYYGSENSETVRITKDLDKNITGLDVIMVEDIVDTGMTLNYLLNYLLTHKPASLRVCALLDKRARRLAEVNLHYSGFEIPDEFVVGYGLDYRGEYRNLPFIGVLTPEVLEKGKS